LTIIKKKNDGATAIDSRVNRDIAESLMDVRVKITVEVGQTRMPIADILNLKIGEMIALAGNAKDPLKIFVNDKLFALGEAVEVNGKLAVRIAEVIGKKASIPAEEIKRSA